MLRADSDESFEASRPAAAKAIRAGKDSEFRSLGLTLGYRCDSSPIVITESNQPSAGNDNHLSIAAPGARLAHFHLDGTSVYDRLGTELSLIGDLSLPAAEQLIKAAAHLGVPLTAVAVDPSACDQCFDARLVLVLPDQHVAWRDDTVADPGPILRTVTGRR